MGEERIPCTACGVMILPATASRTGGLCMPCQRGDRVHIDAARARNEEHRQDMRRYQASAEYRHWSWLVNAVCAKGADFDGMSMLSEADRLYFAVRELGGEVYNGGFDQYFSNSAGAHYAIAVQGLERLGAVRALELLKAGKLAVFGNDDVPVDRKERWHAMNREGDSMRPGMDMTLDALDKQFWEDHDGMDGLLERWVAEHGLRARFGNG